MTISALFFSKIKSHISNKWYTIQGQGIQLLHWKFYFSRDNIIVELQLTRRFSNHESRLLSRSHTFAIIVILDLKIHQSMWIHWPFFPKTWTKGHWPLDDLWPHVCWGHMCDSTQGSLFPSPIGIHQCMWIQWSILQITTYILYHIHVHTNITYYVQNEWSHSLLLNSVQARQKWGKTNIWLINQ